MSPVLLTAGVQTTSLCPVLLTAGVQTTSRVYTLTYCRCPDHQPCLQSYLLQVSRPLTVCPVLLTAGVQTTKRVSSLTYCRCPGRSGCIQSHSYRYRSHLNRRRCWWCNLPGYLRQRPRCTRPRVCLAKGLEMSTAKPMNGGKQKTHGKVFWYDVRGYM